MGLTELICGVVLILIPGKIQTFRHFCRTLPFEGRLKQVANLILLFIMFGAVYTHYALRDPWQRIAPGLVFSALLLVRLMISGRGTAGKKAFRPKIIETPSTAGKAKLVDEAGELRPEEAGQHAPLTSHKASKLNTPRQKKLE